MSSLSYYQYTTQEDFTTPGVVYFASASDSPGPAYPSTSPDGVAAGGTTLRRDPATGNFMSEAAWEYAGGGLTHQVTKVGSRPYFQGDAVSPIFPPWPIQTPVCGYMTAETAAGSLSRGTKKIE